MSTSSSSNRPRRREQGKIACCDVAGSCPSLIVAISPCGHESAALSGTDQARGESVFSTSLRQPALFGRDLSSGEPVPSSPLLAIASFRHQHLTPPLVPSLPHMRANIQQRTA